MNAQAFIAMAIFTGDQFSHCLHDTGKHNFLSVFSLDIWAKNKTPILTDGARVDNMEFFCIHHGVNLKIK